MTRCVYVPAWLDGTNETLTSPISADGRAKAGVRYEIPARQGRALRVAKRQ